MLDYSLWSAKILKCWFELSVSAAHTHCVLRWEMKRILEEEEEEKKTEQLCRSIQCERIQRRRKRRRRSSNIIGETNEKYQFGWMLSVRCLHAIAFLAKHFRPKNRNEKQQMVSHGNFLGHTQRNRYSTNQPSNQPYNQQSNSFHWAQTKPNQNEAWTLAVLTNVQVPLPLYSHSSFSLYWHWSARRSFAHLMLMQNYPRFH